jgi:hypothetical protein
MPDLSHLETLIPNLMTAVMAFEGKNLTKKERLYVRIFVRLIQKAINEYKLTRECVIDQVEDMKRGGEHLFIFGIINHMEDCINATRRLFALLKSVKGERGGGLRIDRQLRKRIEKPLNDVKIIRHFVEHIDEKIQKGETTGPVMLDISDDDERIEIAGYSMRFEDLARLLERFHELAKQWLDDFCREAT